MIEWHFLNFGSKKLKASIDTDIRITGVKTLHIGHAMSFVVNQREGLQGLCLKAGSVLLNVSENLSMAFFWPKKPTNLELVEDRDLSNGEQWLSSYPEEAYDIDLETEDLIENVLPIYHDTGDDERQDIVAGLNEKWQDSYAITKLYDTVEKAQASCAWKFDHWRQFDYTDLDRIEFCFKPVFKLDRINEYVHTNVGGDIQKTSEGYSDDPNRNYGYGVQADYSRHAPIRDSWDGRVFQDIDYYRKTIREEHFTDTPDWYADGSIPTVDYYQIANRFEWYYNYVGNIVIHLCSHQTSTTGGWTVGRDWDPYYGSRTTMLKGKEVVGPGSMDIDDMIPGFREETEASHPSRYMIYVCRLVDDYGYQEGLTPMEFHRQKLVKIGRALTPSEVNSDIGRIFYEEDEETLVEKLVYGSAVSKQRLVAYNLPEAEQLYHQTLKGFPVFDVDMVYFNPISVSAKNVTPSNVDQLLSEGKISLAKEIKWKRVSGVYEISNQRFRYATEFEGAEHGFKYEDLNTYDIDNAAALRDALDEFTHHTIWKDWDSGNVRGRLFSQTLTYPCFFFNMRLPITSQRNCSFFYENLITNGGPDPSIGFQWWYSHPATGFWDAVRHDVLGWNFQCVAFARSAVINQSYMYQLINQNQPNTANPQEMGELMAVLTFEARGWSGWPDSVSAELLAIDASNNILASVSSGNIYSPDEWKRVAINFTIPKGTFILKPEFHNGQSYGGQWYDAHIRNVALQVSNVPGTAYSGSPSGMPWISVTDPRGGGERVYGTGDPSNPRIEWTNY